MTISFEARPSSPLNELLHRKRIDVHAERRRRQPAGHGWNFLILDFHFRFLVDRDGCINAGWSHAPKMALACELYAVYRELQPLLRIGRIQHGERKRSAVVTKSSTHIQGKRIASRIDRWLVTAGGVNRLGLGRISGDLHGNRSEMFAIHLE